MFAYNHKQGGDNSPLCFYRNLYVQRKLFFKIFFTKVSQVNKYQLACL